jgi:hypothetical protein
LLLLLLLLLLLQRLDAGNSLQRVSDL